NKVIAANIELILVEGGGPRNLVVCAKSRRCWFRQSRQQVFRSVADTVGANLVEDAVAGNLRSSSSIRITRGRIIDRIDCCDGTEIAGSKCINWHRIITGCEKVIPHPLVVAKEEDFVLDDGATDAAAKLIPAIAGNPSCVFSKLVGCVKTRGAIVLEKRSVESIRARLRRDLPESTGNLAIFGIVVAGCEL